MMGGMSEFDQFIAAVGASAGKYTAAQLRQLHTDIRKLANVLLAVHAAKTLPEHRVQHSPQGRLDVSGGDRTIKAGITEHDEDHSSRGQDK